MAAERQLFQRQPGQCIDVLYTANMYIAARAVLFDFSPPMTLATLTNIRQSLSNTLSLLNHISSGATRLSYISLIVLGNYPEVPLIRCFLIIVLILMSVTIATIWCIVYFEISSFWSIFLGNLPKSCFLRVFLKMITQVIYPLQVISGNMARLTSALKELGSLGRNMVARQCPTRGCLLEGLQEALAQFSRLPQTYRQVRKEVVIFEPSAILSWPFKQIHNSFYCHMSNFSPLHYMCTIHVECIDTLWYCGGKGSIVYCVIYVLQ